MKISFDMDLFLVYTSSYAIFYPDFRKTIDNLYKTQKFRFYEKARNNPYYNYSFFIDGSLEREVSSKRAFGVLLCAEEDESLKKTIIQSMFLARPELKILQGPFEESQIIKIVQNFSNKYDLVEEANSFLYFLIYISLSQNIESSFISNICENLAGDLKARDSYSLQNILKRVDACNINKKLIIPSYVKEAISLFTSNNHLECLLDIIDRNTFSPMTQRIVDVFKNSGDEAIDDLCEACNHCHRVAEMLSVQGLSFIMMYHGREYTKRDREFILKAFVDYLRNTKDRYTLKFSDFILFLLLDGLAKNYVESKKFYSLNNSETQYNELYRLEKSIDELNKTIDDLKDSLSLEKSFNSKLQEQIQLLNKENSKDVKDSEKALLEEISLLKAQNSELAKRLEKEEEKNQELHKLREFVFELQQSDLKEVEAPNLSDLIKNKKIYIIGGHINWRNKISNKYPSISIIDGHNTSFDSSKLINADIVFLNTVNMSHKLYYKNKINKLWKE